MSISTSDITRSIKKRLDDEIVKSDYEVFVYYDSKINTSKIIRVIVKEAVLPNTDTFVIYDAEKNDLFIQDDITGLYLSDFSNSVKKKIISYDNTTGEIVLESGFDFETYEFDELSISYGDTIFLRADVPFNDNFENSNSVMGKNIRIYYMISTIDDSDKEKIIKIASDFNDIFQNFSYPIYDSDLLESNNLFYVIDKPQQFSEIENNENFQSMSGTMLVRYYNPKRR